MDKPRVLIGWPEQVVDPESVVEWNVAENQRFAEAVVPVCGCGCGGMCGNEQEQDDVAEEDGDGDVGEPDYELTSGQIDGLIQWVKEFGEARGGDIKALQYEDELVGVLEVLEDQWRHKRMTEKQTEAFFDACSHL